MWYCTPHWDVVTWDIHLWCVCTSLSRAPVVSTYFVMLTARDVRLLRKIANPALVQVAMSEAAGPAPSCFLLRSSDWVLRTKFACNSSLFPSSGAPPDLGLLSQLMLETARRWRVRYCDKDKYGDGWPLLSTNGTRCKFEDPESLARSRRRLPDAALEHFKPSLKEARVVC